MSYAARWCAKCDAWGDHHADRHVATGAPYTDAEIERMRSGDALARRIEDPVEMSDGFNEGCPDCGSDSVTHDEDDMEHCAACGWRP